MRIELPFDRNTVYNGGLSNVRNNTFVQNGSIQVNVRSSISLGVKQCVLEAGRSSKFFSYGNCVNFGKEYCLLLMISKWEEYLLGANSSFQMN
jgi:hypothetical protein